MSLFRSIKKISCVLVAVMILSLSALPVFAATTIEVKHVTDISVSEDNWWDRGVQYGRILVLNNQPEEENNVLLATHCELNSGLTENAPGYPIYRSTDNGKTWEVSGDAQLFYALYAPVSVSGFDSIKAVISADFGEPTYTNHTLPAELIPSVDTGTFWMAWKSHNRFCYWCNDTINIGWGLFEEELINDTGYAYLCIERK